MKKRAAGWLVTGCALLVLFASPAVALDCVGSDYTQKPLLIEGVVQAVSVKDASAARKDCDHLYDINITNIWRGSLPQDSAIRLRQTVWLCEFAPQRKVGDKVQLALDAPENSEFSAGICDAPFFNPYDKAGKLTEEFKAHLDALKAKEAE